MKAAAILIALLPLASAAVADTRHASTVAAFRKANACPGTGKVQRTCPGYVIDHPWPLCAGGPDTVDNMRWQTKEASYKKDIEEREACRRLKACATEKEPKA